MRSGDFFSFFFFLRGKKYKKKSPDPRFYNFSSSVIIILILMKIINEGMKLNIILKLNTLFNFYLVFDTFLSHS